MEKIGVRKQTKVEDSMSIWTEFREIGDKYGCATLSEGTPNLQPPDFLLENYVKAVKEGHNQYTFSNGHPIARKLIAEFYSEQFKRTLDPEKEILITNGGLYSLHCLLHSLVSDENDEVIFLEPMFPLYLGQGKLSRGTMRFVPFKLDENNEWQLDLKILRETLNDKTRVIVLNTPHNPTGKVFTLEELTEISNILEEFPHVYVISDEVYSFLTFDGHEHHCFANIGDNWKKTATIISGGKIFCCTGWKVGWTIGPADMIKQATIICDASISCHNVPGQVAMARSLKRDMEKIGVRKQTKVEDSMSIWTEFREIGDKYGCATLSEGTPNLQPPDFLLENYVKAVKEGHNQYTFSNGHPIARKLIAEFYSEQFKRTLDPEKEILITNGGLYSLHCLLHSLVSDENDEVIFLEPMFPLYLGQGKLSRGTMRFVPFKLDENNEWQLDLKILRETLNDKTRVIVLNTPHNPTGKVFTLEELTEISNILEEFPHVYVISDEVYSFLTFDGHEHHCFANIGDNWKKTATIISGGKIFCCTGWKVGWTIGPADMIKQATIICDASISCHNVPGQVAMARSLKRAFTEEYEGFKSYSEYVKNDFQKTHKLLIDGLKDVGVPIKAIPSHGCYFVLAEISELRDLVPEKYFKSNEYEEDRNTSIDKNNFGLPVPLDLAVSRWLAMEKKIIVLPGTFFYHRDSKSRSDKYIRLAFCKGEKTVGNALRQLKAKM